MSDPTRDPRGFERIQVQRTAAPDPPLIVGAPRTPATASGPPCRHSTIHRKIGHGEDGEIAVDAWECVDCGCILIERIEREAAHLDVEVLARALTSEDEIAHGEAVTEDANGQRRGLGECAYCRDVWPCRTQRGIDRLIAALEAGEPSVADGRGT